MKSRYLPVSHRNFSFAAFTIVELLVVITVIAILVAITTVGFSQWRSRAAVTELKADASGVIAAMEDIRNRQNGYPIFAVGTQFDGSATTKNIFTQNKNVLIVYAGGDDTSYCLDFQSKASPTLRMFVNTAGGNQVIKTGTCDGGENTSPINPAETIFVFNTAAAGCGGTVQLPIAQPTTSTATINWGDGSSETLSSALQSHTYTTPGVYVVTYGGPITQISYSLADATMAKCLTKVTQWGSGAAPTILNFKFATNFLYVAEPPTTVTNMGYLFYGASNFNQPIGGWDISKVTTLYAAFMNASAFNQPIGNWNTSKVTTLQSAFYGATAFNQPLASWDTSRVTSMYTAFYNASAFNQPIGTWDTSKVTTMYAMFYGASTFNQPLASWNTGLVNNMSYMFRGAAAFNQPLASFNTANVTTMSYMFNAATAFNQNISGWNVGNVTTFVNFHLSSALTQANCPTALW